MVPSEPGVKNIVRDHLSRIMQALQKSAATTYILDSQCRFIYCNPAWDRFAKSNGASHLTGEAVVGSDLFDAVPDVLMAVYSAAFQEVLGTGLVWEQSYECSSPTIFRIFRMRVHLLKPQNWFLVTNTLVLERSHMKVAEPDQKKYVDSDGLITTCAHCRCSRRVDNPDQWDFVPEHLQLGRESAMKVSHALCPVCRAYFYPLY